MVMTHPSMYHERQVMQLCALHSINNLLQKKAFTKHQFDLICQKLAPNTWINPHRSMIGIGNYDVNVLSVALQQHQLELIWFDKRKSVSCIRLENVFGFILNVSNQDESNKSSLLSVFGYFRSRNHWFSVRKVQDLYYNLDSKLAAPSLIGKENELIKYLESRKSQPNCELFVVTLAELSDQVFDN